MTARASAPYPPYGPSGWAGDPYTREGRFLTEGVLLRRIVACALDAVLIALLAGSFWVAGVIFGVLTFGLGLSVLHALPLIPLAYNWMFLMSPLSATPGQRMMDLIVRRNADLGPPGGFEALVFVLGYYVTLALGVIWLGIALFTERKRTPHDLLSRLLVVRARAFAELTAPPQDWNIGQDWNSDRGGRSDA